MAGLGSYWIYQHLGNLPPGERADDGLLKALRAADGDAGQVLDEFAWQADQAPGRQPVELRPPTGRQPDHRAGLALRAR